MSGVSNHPEDLADRLRQHSRCLVRSPAGSGVSLLLARHIADVARQSEALAVVVVTGARALVGQWAAQVSQQFEGPVRTLEVNGDLIDLLDEHESLPSGVTVLPTALLRRTAAVGLLKNGPLGLLVISELHRGVTALMPDLADLVGHADQSVVNLQGVADVPSLASAFHRIELEISGAGKQLRRHVYEITERERSIVSDGEHEIGSIRGSFAGASSRPVLHEELLMAAQGINREIPADGPEFEHALLDQTIQNLAKVMEHESGGEGSESGFQAEVGSTRIWNSVEQVEQLESDPRLDAVLEVVAQAAGRPCVISVAVQLEAHYVGGFLADKGQNATLVLDDPESLVAALSKFDPEAPQIVVATARSLQGVELPADSLHLIWSVVDPDNHEELLALVNRGGEAVLLASEPALPADYRVGKTLRDAGRMG